MDIQLVFQFSVSETTDFDRLLSLENLLQFILGEDHLVDGHDFGSDEMNIFVLTNNAEAAFSLCEPKIPYELKLSLKAAYRRLDEDRYHWLYPEGNSEEFKIA
jgi:hypothetical protein